MIVRVSTEGQYELQDGPLSAGLEERELPGGAGDDIEERVARAADDTPSAATSTIQAAVEADDGERFHGCYDKLLELIRSQGSELKDDDLRGSDLTLPPPDITLEEAQSEFSAHGLIPD